MLGHKTTLNTFKGKEIIQSIFANHKEINGIRNQETEGNEKFTNTWKLWVKEEIVREIRKYFEMNTNESITYQNLWNVVKTVPRGKFIAVYDIIKRSQMNNLIFPVKKPEK